MTLNIHTPPSSAEVKNEWSHASTNSAGLHGAERYMITFTFTFTNVGQDSSVGIATRYGLDGPGIESR